MSAKRIGVLILFVFAPLLAQSEAGFNGSGIVQEQPEQGGFLWTEKQAGTVDQIYDLMYQLGETMGTIPPGVGRIAVYHLSIDRREFTAGIARFMKSQIETVFRQKGRRQVVAAPGLKTTRITMTDSSFKMTNHLPNVETLWDVGRKLGIDAFIEGACTRTEEGDMLMSIKLIRQETGEIIWSENFAAGPNKVKRNIIKPEWGIMAGFSYWQIQSYDDGRSVVQNPDAKLYHYYFEGNVGEAVSHTRRFYLNLAGGVGFYVPVIENKRDSAFEDLQIRMEIMAGPDLNIILAPKPDPREGYYASLLLGIRAVFPHKFMVTQIGLQSRLTRRLGLSIVASYYPLHRTFTPTLSASDFLLTMNTTAYDGRIHFYF
jgi:hypothetical protein